MIFQEKTILLKDGSRAILRAPLADDAAEMVRYLKDLAAETEFVANYPEEIGYTEEGERAYLDANRASANELMIVCTVNGKLAGNSQIVFGRSIKTRHRATLMIGLRREFWNLGIGTALFREMIAAAAQHGTERLELEMIEGNERGMALYRKMGFSVVATIPDAFRLKDGSRRASVLMAREV